MVYINKKLVVILVLLLFLTAGLFVFKSLYSDRIPKSAKLVFLLKE